MGSGQAWREFCASLAESGERILGPDFPQDTRARAEGFRALTRLLVYALQSELEAGDPDHPTFVRHQDPHNQWGGPNPDNVYLRARIDPARTYRVRANVRDVRQAIFSLHEGDLQLGDFGVYGECSLADLEVGDDGELELWISPDPHPGNCIRTDPKARLFTIRVYQTDWEHDAAPSFYIVRADLAGVPRPPLDPGHAARALQRAAHWVERSSQFWNAYTAAGAKQATPNLLGAPRSAPGGADNILYGNCFWDLGDDEALLITLDVPDAQYWGFALHTLAWLESGDFADRQTSLNLDQVHVDEDARVRLVLSHRDPGVPNWLDSEGRARGLLVYRFVWAKSAPVPQARVVGLPELRSALPATHPRVDPAERRTRLARRREQAWRRFR